MQLSLVNNADCLALAALNGFRRNQVNFRINAEHRAHCRRQPAFARLHFGNLIRKTLGRAFHVNIKGIRIVHTVNHNLIVRRVALLEQNGFNLAREHVDAADNHHIVASAERLRHLDMRSSAGAFFAR